MIHTKLRISCGPVRGGDGASERGGAAMAMMMRHGMGSGRSTRCGVAEGGGLSRWPFPRGAAVANDCRPRQNRRRTITLTSSWSSMRSSVRRSGRFCSLASLSVLHARDEGGGRRIDRNGRRTTGRTPERGFMRNAIDRGCSSPWRRPSLLLQSKRRMWWTQQSTSGEPVESQWRACCSPHSSASFCTPNV